MRTMAVLACVTLLVLPAPARADGANWQGFYAGLHAGYGWGHSDTDIRCDDPAGVAGGGPDCFVAIAVGALRTSHGIDLGGAVGGVQAGYNLQSGNLVYGVEADFSWSSIDGSDSSSTNVPPFFPELARVSQDVEWLSTVRARLGYAPNASWLIYATGGLAIAEVEYDYKLSFPGVPTWGLKNSDSAVQTGWTAGGGVEHRFGQFSLKTEYLYFDLGEEDLSAQLVVSGAPLPVFARSEFDTQGHIGRIGLNFHFD